MAEAPEVDLFFHDRPEARRLFDALRHRVESWGDVEVVATKSRVAFVRRTCFLWVHEAGLGHIWLGFNLPHALDSPRLRSGSRGNKWSHHLKVAAEEEMDQELMGWLRQAWDADAPLATE